MSLIIGSGIPMALSALTHNVVILIIAAFFWMIFILAGIGIIASELGERRKKKPVKNILILPRKYVLVKSAERHCKSMNANIVIDAD